MSWETRGDGRLRRYYYSARRVGGKVVKAYRGGGTVGLHAAQADDERRLREQGEALVRARRRAELIALDDLTQALHERCALLAEAALLAAGYRRHNRWKWRRWHEAHRGQGT
jgi:hypothetical protein